MPEYVYVDDEPRVYHDFGVLKNGDVVIADQLPDHRFALVEAKATPSRDKE